MDKKRMLWFWVASFLAFPLGGLLARVVGPVDELWVAFVACAIAGAVIGAGQWLAGASMTFNEIRTAFRSPPPSTSKAS